MNKLTLAMVAVAVGSAGCTQQESPVQFSFSIPEPNVLGFQATLTQRYGIGLAGSFDLPKNVGRILLVPESSSQGFGLGLNLNTRAFLRETWVDFREVNGLPTGASFPSWMGVPLVDVAVPELNRGGVDYHFYFGARGQFYVGAAGVIHAIDERFPAVNIGYTFYDKQGRVVLGFQFFGPKIGSNGRAEVPGGIFIGTNLSPFIPAGSKNVGVTSQALAFATPNIERLAAIAISGAPVKINGQSVQSHIVTSGRDAGRYRTKADVKKVLDRYFEASRRTY